MSSTTETKKKTKEYVSKGNGYKWRHGSNVIQITANDDGTFDAYIRVDKGCNFRYSDSRHVKSAEEANEAIEAAYAWLAKEE
jgi:hypothetical protein